MDRAHPSQAPSSQATWTEMPSVEDLSVNFVRATPDGGAVECRYVRREDGYFIAYLSSHTGCRQACRFCHLTSTGQTMFEPVDFEGFLAQADRVLVHYDGAAPEQGPARRVNFNWMARGEPLSNRLLLSGARDLVRVLEARAAHRGLSSRFNFSTIMPEDAAGVDLARAFGSGPIQIYYSLYSLSPKFRKRWLPRAMDPRVALAKLADFQRETGNDVALHWAFIAGENDDPADARAIVELVKEMGLRAKFNAVRYNSYSPAQGEEASEEAIGACFAVLSELSSESRIVPRVGHDVKASCGMFVETGAHRRNSTFYPASEIAR